MIISGAWWLLITFIVGVIVSSISLFFEDSGGGGFIPYFDFLRGCIIPTLSILISIIIGLLLWALKVTLTIGLMV